MCVLRVSGKQFDVDAYLAVSELTADVSEGVIGSSGFTVAVSDAPWDGLKDQVRDAVAFLNRHQVELERLRSTPGVDEMRLDFPIRLRIDGQTFDLSNIAGRVLTLRAEPAAPLCPLCPLRSPP